MQLGYSFAFDAPTIWNDLSDNVCSAYSVAYSGRNVSHICFQGFPLIISYLAGTPIVTIMAMSMERLSIIKVQS